MSDDLRFSTKLVTPQQATRWLEGNVANRLLRDHKVAEYARDMKAGRWRLTHEPIAFSNTGALINGQHRLWAVIEADVPVKFTVAYNVPDDARGVIDSGLIRTDADHLKFGYGITVTTTVIGVARNLLSVGKGRPTTAEIKQALDTYGEAIAFAVSSFPRRVKKITTVPIITVIVRAVLANWPREQIRAFTEALASGRIGQGEDAVLLLRNYIIERAPTQVGGSGTRTLSNPIYAKTERALWAYLHGEQIAILYPASQELFPLPHEATVVARVKTRTTAERRERGGTRTTVRVGARRVRRRGTA